MMPVATARDAWNPETVTARCVNIGPAAIAAGAVGVKAGTSRLGSIACFKDCRSASDFQASSHDDGVNFRAMPVARARSQWESEMDRRKYTKRPFSPPPSFEPRAISPEMQLRIEADGVLKKARGVWIIWTLLPPAERLTNPLLDLTDEQRQAVNPLHGVFPLGQLDRLEHAIRQKVAFHEQSDAEEMLAAMRAGAVPGDVAPAPSEPAAAADRSESPIERALLTALRWSVLPCDDPARIKADCERAPGKRGVFLYQQAPVLHYRADFLLGAMASPDAAPHWVVVECDGHEFHERTAEQAEHDRARDRAMTAAGYRVFRFTGREIQRDAGRCAAEVMKYLRPFAGPKS